MTARMMMLNCVQETSVRAAVVLSVGLLRLVNRAWVVAAVLSTVLVLLLDVEAGTPLAVAEVKVVLVVGVEWGGVRDVGACVVVASAGVGRSRGAEERKAVKKSEHFKILFHSFVKIHNPDGSMQQRPE